MAVAQMVRAMAVDLQLLPQCFAHESRTGAPLVALVVLTCIEVFFALLASFDYLIQLSSLLHVVVLWSCLAAFVRLRTMPVDRLFSVPGESIGACMIVLAKVPVLSFFLYSACAEPGLVVGAVGMNGLFFGIAAIASLSVRAARSNRFDRFSLFSGLGSLAASSEVDA